MGPKLNSQKVLFKPLALPGPDRVGKARKLNATSKSKVAGKPEPGASSAGGKRI